MNLSNAIPWVQCTEPGEPLDNMLAGLGEWEEHCPSSIVMTTPNMMPHVLRPARACVKPNHCLRGGVLTYPCFEGRTMESGDGWAEVAQAAMAAAHWTGRDAVVLDNEVTWKQHIAGDQPLNLARVAAALKVIADTSLTVWWNLPRIMPGTDAFKGRLAATTKLVDVFSKAVPNSKFMDAYGAWYGQADDQRDRQLMMADLIGGERMMPRVLASMGGTMSGRRCCTPEDLKARLSLDSRRQILWTGQDDWLKVAKAMGGE